MRIKIVLTWFTLLISTVAFSQKKVDFDSIKLKITDKNSPYFYSQLKTNFYSTDTQHINTLHAHYLYYGFVFQNNYKPNEESPEVQKFFALFRNKDFKNAIAIGEEELKKNPVNMEVLLGLISAYKHEKDSINTYFHRLRYYALSNAIIASGEGKNPIVLIDTKDEYIILERLKIERIEQKLIGNQDIIKLQMPNPLNREQLCFDIEKPMENMKHQYKNK